MASLAICKPLTFVTDQCIATTDPWHGHTGWHADAPHSQQASPAVSQPLRNGSRTPPGPGHGSLREPKIIQPMQPATHVAGPSASLSAGQSSPASPGMTKKRYAMVNFMLANQWPINGYEQKLCSLPGTLKLSSSLARLFSHQFDVQTSSLQPLSRLVHRHSGCRWAQCSS